MTKEPTPEEMEAYFDKLLNKLKQDPLYNQRQELGNMLMRHIDSFTPAEKIRYDELLIICKSK